MVDTQVRTEGVTDLDIIRAMEEVPRERFVPARARPFAYSDADILVKEEGHHRRLMRPATLARLIQAAELAPTDFVLVVGAATGYAAALIANLATSVIALELDEGLAAEASATLMQLGVGNVAVVSGPLEQGYPSEGPYDAISPRRGGRGGPGGALRATQGRRAARGCGWLQPCRVGHGLFQDLGRHRRPTGIRCVCAGFARVHAAENIRLLTAPPGHGGRVADAAGGQPPVASACLRCGNSSQPVVSTSQSASNRRAALPERV